MILGGGLAVCLLLSAHRAVIFAIAQLFCFITNRVSQEGIAIGSARLSVCASVCSVHLFLRFAPTDL